MNRWWKIILGIVLATAVNVAGKYLASYFNLPIYADCIGTIAISYFFGALPGVLVGIFTGCLSLVWDPVNFFYLIPSVAVALFVGLKGRRSKMLSHPMSAAGMGLILAGICTILTTVISSIISGGLTGNVWGDSVIAYLVSLKWPSYLACFVGDFYLEFVDKLLSVFVAFGFAKLFAWWKEKKRRKTDDANTMLFPIFPFLLGTTLVLCGTIGTSERAFAATISDSARYIQTVYDSDDGILIGKVNDVAQTEDGSLWFATYAGLYRFNGADFQLMDNLPTVKNANDLFVDESGNLWIGTNDLGVSVYRDGEVIATMDEDTGLPSNSVKNIVCSSDGYYYVGTTDTLVVLELSEDGLRRVAEIPSVAYTRSLSAGTDGMVAAVTKAGELVLMKNGGVVNSTTLEDKEYFSACSFAKDGLLYLGTGTGRVLIWKVSDGSFQEVQKRKISVSSAINDFYFDDNGYIYVCDETGLGYFHERGGYVRIQTGAFNNSVCRVTKDYQNNFWFVSSNLGILRLCPSSFTDLYSDCGLESRVVNTSQMYNGHLYVGTDEGLQIINLENGDEIKDEITRQFEGVRIRCLMVEGKDLWICTYGMGAYRLCGNELSCINSENGLFGDRIRFAIALREGNILLGGNGGLALCTDGVFSENLCSADLSDEVVLCALELEDGTILAGTDGDGLVAIRDGKISRKVTRKEGLSSNVVMRMVPDPAGNIFVVTGNGLCYLDDTFQASLVEQFPYFNNYDVTIMDNGKMLVLSSAGVFLLDWKELMSGSDFRYTLLDNRVGLPGTLTSNSWNCLDDDLLFLAGSSGVYILDTLNYSGTELTYRMKLNNVTLDGESVEQKGDELVIPAGTSNVQFSLEVFNYSTTNPYIMYYLEGYDSIWSGCYLNELSSFNYRNLPHGTYRLFVNVLEDKNGEVLSSVTYDIRKENEFYDNAWFKLYFYGLLVLMIALQAWVITWTIVRNATKKQQEALAAAKEKLEMGNQTILAIAKTVDAKDSNTSMHSHRVSEYSVMIAEAIGMSEEDKENLRQAALLHDIGKIGIPDSVLNKAGRLTDREFAMMRSHVIRGGEILREFTLIDHVAEGARYHHERYDGSGYAEGLKGQEIPLFARIIGVADAFDAMTANRIYRKKLNIGTVVGEMRKNRGTQFDPRILDVFLSLIDEGKIDLSNLYADGEGIKNEEEARAIAEKAGEIQAAEDAKRQAEEEAAMDAKQ